MRRAGATAMIAAILLTASARAQTAPPTTQSLEHRMIALAPMLSIDDPATKSLDVQLVIDAGNARLLIRALYDGPGRNAMYVSDARDGTPVCVIADGRMIVYDPFEGILRVSENASSSLDVRQKGDQFSLNFGFKGNVKGEPAKPTTLTVDLASIVTASRDTVAHDLGDGMYGVRLRGRKPTTVLHAAVDPRRSCPYLRLEMTSDGKPALALDPITRNEPVDPAAFVVPATAELAKHVPVKPWPGEGVLAAARGSQVFMHILIARLAIDDPKWRAELDKNFLTRVDWDKVKANDAKLAPVLRELFPLAIAAPSGGGATTRGAATKPASHSNGPPSNIAR